MRNYKRTGRSLLPDFIFCKNHFTPLQKTIKNVAPAKLIIPALCMAASLLPYRVPCHSEAPFYSHFTYMFFHAGIFHLGLNLIALYSSVNNRMFPYRILLPLLYAVAIASSFVWLPGMPTVGASTLAYAMFGINGAYILSRKTTGWKPYTALLTLGLVSGFFIPRINGMAHLSAFLLGMGCGYIRLRSISDLYKKQKRTSSLL